MFWLVITAGVVLLLATSGEKKPGGDPGPLTPTCPRPGTRVLIIGDSLGVGLASELKRLADKCIVPFGGDISVGAHVTDGFGMIPFSPVHGDIVLISLGGNDYNRTDPDNVREAISRTVKDFNRNGAMVLWIAPPPMPVTDRNGVKESWIEAVGDDHWFDTPSANIPQGPDKIHPTGMGYKQLAGLLWAWLAEKSYS